MKKQIQQHIRLLIIGWIVLSVLSCGAPDAEDMPTVTPVPPTATSVPTATLEPAAESTPAAPQAEDRDVRRNLVRSTVQIIALTEEDGRFQPMWSGSGSILSPDGLILTNAHVVHAYDPAYQPDALGVALTNRSDDPPDLQYLAEIQSIDVTLDLAVIQITSDLDGRPLDMEQLDLDYVSLADSDVLELGDLVRVLGYPGIGGETITFTEGSVSGFSRERGVEGRAWIKTDATIAGGNSGGLAANLDGKAVGVPTQVGYGGGEEFADCRYLADTNNDGVIDENDNCIPVGGFINALRPINLAKPLLEAARTGVGYEPPSRPAPSGQPAGDARFQNLVFSPDVTNNDQPTQIVSQLPSGATDIYAFWDYENVADGVTWEARWYYEGEFIEAASQPPQPWMGGERGSWWVSIHYDYGLDDGVYRVELYVADERLLEGTITVGGAVTGYTFTNLVFSDGITANDQPVDPAYLLPSGIGTIYAFFDYEAMEDGVSWGRAWYHEGQEIGGGSDTWDWGRDGSAWVSLESTEGFEPGAYRLDLFVEDKVVATSKFVLVGTPDQEAIGPITFAAGVDQQDNPVDPGASFPSGLEALYFFVDYAGLWDGMGFEERWLLDGEELATFNNPWQFGESGVFHNYIYQTRGGSLPDGEYTLEIYIEGQLVQSDTAIVGTGVAPDPPPPPAEGVYIQGYILDADTGRGIPGAAYVVLKPGIAIDEWDSSDAQVYTWAEADADGYFELPDPLARGERYSIIVGAPDYLPTGGDHLLVGDDPSPLEVEVMLQKE